jgi:hypothetical protein
MSKELPRKYEINPKKTLSVVGEETIGKIQKIMVDLESAGDKPSEKQKNRYGAGKDNFEFINGAISASLTEFIELLGTAKDKFVVKLGSSLSSGYSTTYEIDESNQLSILNHFWTSGNYLKVNSTRSTVLEFQNLGRLSKADISTRVIKEIKVLANLSIKTPNS